MGQHRRIYRTHYRAGNCPGIAQPAVLEGPDPMLDTTAGQNG